MKDPQKLLARLGDRLMAAPGRKIRLKNFDPRDTGGFKERQMADDLLAKGCRKLSLQQERLYAQDTWALLVVFQAMDAAGKDGTIKHVMSGVNPQGCQVFSFKAPSAEERDHDYLWRSVKGLPERGRIGIHNRSYYEEVLVARVHPQILQGQQLPAAHKTKHIWRERYAQINNFERFLVENGTKVIKFFLNVSKEEQKKRFLERIDMPEKNWKFALGDVAERAHWDTYMDAYEDVFTYTSTKHAPWYIIPADNKWFMRLAVAELMTQALAGLKIKFPEIDDARRLELKKAREMLVAEKKSSSR